MRMELNLTGDKELMRALRRLGDAGKRQSQVATVATAEKIMADAKRSIQRGEKTGRIYGGSQPNASGRRGNNRSKSHQASAPGEPPATDTGNLVASGRAIHEADGSTVEFRAPYAEWLEFGTLRMAERPFLRPAIAGSVEFYQRRLELAVKRAMSEAAR